MESNGIETNEFMNSLNPINIEHKTTNHYFHMVE